jgi:hypothetical protein
MYRTHSSGVGKGENRIGVWWESQKEWNQLEHLGLHGDHIKIGLREKGWGSGYCSNLAQDREQCMAIMNMEISLQVPLNVWIYLSIWGTGGFSRQTPLHWVGYLVSNTELCLKWRHIKIGLREKGWGSGYCSNLAQDKEQCMAIMNMEISLQVPLNIWIYLSIWGTCGFSRQTHLHW